MFTFFTELLKKDVVDRYGRFLGHPYDFFADLSGSYPKLTALVVTVGIVQKNFFTIPWSQFTFSEEQFRLKGALDSFGAQKKYQQEGVPTLRQSILDQQVVDTYNRKVVRVNDIHLLSVGGELRLAHVDVGMRGLVRRLGWEKTIDAIVRLFNRHASYLILNGFIAWKYVQPLSIRDAAGRVKLNVDQESLRHIPPSDISEMLMELDPHQRSALLRTLDVARQVDILTELDLKWQRDLIEDFDTKAAVALFERMPADEATDLLQALSKRDVARIMGELSIRKAREISGLLKHETDSAGGLMTTEYFVLTPSMKVLDAI